MPTTFNALEREKTGALVNNLSVFAAQLLTRNNSDLTTRALANLAKIRREQTDLLKRVDKLAREQNEERPLRLIEDLVSVPTDIAQMLSLVRRCLFASASIGHLLAQAMHTAGAAAEAASEAKRLH
jgi:hypothetical protein